MNPVRLSAWPRDGVVWVEVGDDEQLLRFRFRLEPDATSELARLLARVAVVARSETEGS